MNITLLNRVLFASLLTIAACQLRAAEEDDLMATLRSGADAPQKWSACQRLRAIGTPKSVPAIAPLLTDERLSQAARHALEGLPYPEAGEALRASLGKTSGVLRAGIIDSLGWRGEASSVPALAPLLTDNDAVVAGAAAAALGRIGGASATTALFAALPDAAAPNRPVIQESLLKCAERALKDNDSAAAATVYRRVFQAETPVQIHTAAWRGLALADSSGRADLIVSALTGQDRPIQLAAQKLVRELRDRGVIQVCVNRWTSLPVEAQVAVLDAQAKLGAEALPTVRLASQSPEAALRMAAWQAAAELNDATAVPGLAKAAASGDGVERELARDVLTQLRGAECRQALLARLKTAPAPEKAELLLAIGERGDREAVDVLLQNAAGDAAEARLAALQALSRLAPPKAIAPLLDLAVKAKADNERDAVFKALYAVCETSPNKEQTARSIIESMGRFQPADRRQVLPLLAELATPDALQAAQAASRNADPELAREAARVLGQWPNAAPAASLLELARSTSDATLQTLALRGAIDVAGQEPDLGKRLDVLQAAFNAAGRAEEKKQALGQVGQVASRPALDLALQQFSNPDLAAEAALAAVSIAEKLAATDPKLGDEVGAKVLEQVKEGDVARRAWALRLKPSSAEAFIRDWVVAGPYRQAGIAGAEAVFNITFGPEKPGQKVDWRSMAPADSANLAGLFPGADNCVAYLRTHVIAPQDCTGALLTGSDDGIKVWLNGEVVQSKNVDRGQVVDQDVAPIKLKKGANELIVKVSQGGGGWSACARIVGQDGKPIRGLMVERPTTAAQAIAASKPTPPPTAHAATLPPRDHFKTLRLSEQFYTEGAYYGDFNRDGKLDVVAGPFWFEGPDFQKRHEYRPVKVYDPKDYSDNFLTFTGDFNADGWTDILCVPFPGAECFWYENPQGKEEPWKKHLAYPNVGNESPMWGDMNGDGKPELLFCKDDYMGYAGPDTSKPNEPWVFHVVSTKDKRYQRFTHGIGFGDVNGDQRVDMIESVGWWEQPADPKPDQPWIFHPFHFADGGAQMLVYDVNGDGLADIITTWHCHEYGLLWWAQTKAADGQAGWEKHVILSPTPDISSTDFRVSQMHAFDLADMNGDGLKDIITGKRYWAHGPSGDKEPSAPPIVFWLELRRSSNGGVSFVPHLIDDNSGVGTQVAAKDLNGDGRPDVIVGNKKGIFVHLSEGGSR